MPCEEAPIDEQEAPHSAPNQDESKSPSQSSTADAETAADEAVPELDPAENDEEDTNALCNNINYGIILAFFDKFQSYFSFKELALFKNLESSLSNKKICSY